MARDYTFYGWPPKPPVGIPENRKWDFLCVTCNQPGEALSPRTNTHPGACRDARIAQEQARSLARLRQKRAAAKAAAR